MASIEVAQVAATVLVDNAHAGHTYEVTGPEALSLAEATALLAALTGGGPRYVHESLDEGRAWRAATGAPAWEVEVWLGSYLAMRTGDLSHVSGDVAAITGRAPLTIDGYVAQHPELLARFSPARIEGAGGSRAPFARQGGESRPATGSLSGKLESEEIGPVSRVALAIAYGATLVSCDADCSRYPHLRWENLLKSSLQVSRYVRGAPRSLVPVV